MRYLAYHEKNRHGSVGFPMELYCVDEQHPRYEMPFHWHVECELVYVMDGIFSMVLDGENISVLPGQCLFVPSGTIHGGTPQNCTYRCLVVDVESFLQNNPTCLSIYKNQLGEGSKIRRCFTKECMATQILVRWIQVLEIQEEGYWFEATGLLWQWLGCVWQHPSLQLPAEEKSNHDKRKIQMKQVLRHIRKEYARELSLKQLAADAGLNPQYFCKVFREVTGRTPIEYVNYYRIECAAEQLSTTNESITEVALSCGFRDLSYFNRLFRKQKGISPTRYRKKE